MHFSHFAEGFFLLRAECRIFLQLVDDGIVGEFFFQSRCFQQGSASIPGLDLLLGFGMNRLQGHILKSNTVAPQDKFIQYSGICSG